MFFILRATEYFLKFWRYLCLFHASSYSQYTWLISTLILRLSFFKDWILNNRIWQQTQRQNETPCLAQDIPHPSKILHHCISTKELLDGRYTVFMERKVESLQTLCQNEAEKRFAIRFVKLWNFFSLDPSGIWLDIISQRRDFSIKSHIFRVFGDATSSPFHALKVVIEDTKQKSTCLVTEAVTEMFRLFQTDEINLVCYNSGLFCSYDCFISMVFHCRKKSIFCLKPALIHIHSWLP